MKRLLPFVSLLLLLLILLFPVESLSGAKAGLSLWWNSVFPALLPSFICLKLTEKLGLLRTAFPRPRGRLGASMAFSLLSGAPNGAKLMGALTRDGTVPDSMGQRLLPLVNSISPVFLLTIIASDRLKNKALFRPMAAAFYGPILCLSLPLLIHGKKSPVDREAGPVPSSFPDALSAAIEESMLDMLRIGGCILFACTLLSLARRGVTDPFAAAALSGFLEVSTGTAAIAALPLSLRLRTALLAGAAAFGGLSLALQALCCYPNLKLLPYLLRKLLLGAAVGGLCYALFPLFPALSSVFAARDQVLSRTLSLGALALSSALSAGFLFLLSLMAGGKRAKN